MPRTARQRPYKPTEGTISNSGDHGPTTKASKASTVLVAVPGDKNGMKRKQRIGALELEFKKGGMTQRQFQAGKEIRDTFEATQKSPPAIQEIYVDSCKTPDATIDKQCDAQSEYAKAMKGIPPKFKYIVEHVCTENRPLEELPGGEIMVGSHRACLMVSLECAANVLGY